MKPVIKDFTTPKFLIRTYEPNLGDSWTESKEVVSKLCKTSYATEVFKAQKFKMNSPYKL